MRQPLRRAYEPPKAQELDGLSSGVRHPGSLRRLGRKRRRHHFVWRPGAPPAGAGAPGHGGQGLVDCADGRGQPVSVGPGLPQPERGFYRFATDPSKITATSLAYVVADGQRLVYTPGDLSAYRTRDLPSTYLTKLNTALPTCASRASRPWCGLSQLP